ncbi:hypothetical protein [Nocardiopsis suaedae]|uniref:Transposase n=1 Tax=Nocardiopsis suaedae TaxID=3018444 RepID=A0ABT4TIP0_9ACTN|nr:hypothetical protein [Nocardiopsis suaedae]MDA2804558.1 hypothetical protein [Nocardiopsis suaedae]
MTTITEAPVRRLYTRQAETWITSWPELDEIATCPECTSFRNLRLHWVQGEEDQSLFSCGCGATWHDSNWATRASMALVLANCGQGHDEPGLPADVPEPVRALVAPQPRRRR